MSELSSFLHTPAWERLLRLEGLPVQRDEGFLYSCHTLPLGGTYWLTSRVQGCLSWELPAFVKNAWFMRIQAEDQLTHQAILTKYGKSVRETASVQPRQTVYLDLSKPETELLAAMKPKHRYNIRVAEKAGVTTEVIHRNVSEAFPRFWKLLEETAGRHDFRTHARSHYEAIITAHEPDNTVFLAFATHEGTDVAAVMVVTCGSVATYLHGGSSYSHRALMAPHLLHFSVIRYLQKLGIHTYDLWGTNAIRSVKNGEWEPIANHPSAGTTRFKLGFGGTIVEYPPTVDIVINPFCYSGYMKIRGFRSRKRAFS